MTKKKNVLDQFDFIRAIACFGIVLFHFAVEYGWPLAFRDFGGGVTYGDIYVTVFFFISGALLFYNHRQVEEIKLFYKKRAFSIFPPFYIAWGLLYLRDVLRYKNLFYRGNPFSIILSLVGMDGYLAYKVQDYYIIGEWFIGAVILLYLLYPLLAWFDKKCKSVTVCGIIFLYILSLWINISGMVPFRTLPSCLLSFYIGMFFVDYRTSAEKYWWIGAILVVCVKFVAFGNVNLKGHVVGIGMAYFLYGIGTYFMKNSIIKRIIQFFSGLSYYIFLTHHLTICLLIKFVPVESNVIIRVILLLVVLGVTVVSAMVLRQIWLTIRRICKI